jgi:hypothetical protein
MATETETYHVTRTQRSVNGFDVFGHLDTTCNALGCAGDEFYLGSYDPSEVEHDGESFWTETDSGLTVNLGIDR